MFLIVTEIFLIFILPVLLWHLKIIPFKLRFWIMIAFLAPIFAIIFFEKITSRELGLRLDNLHSSLLVYFISLLIGILAILLINKWINKKSFKFTLNYVHFPGDFVIVSAAQEFAYRSFLMIQLAKILNSAFMIIFLDALLFSLPHSLYKRKTLATVTTFLAGIIFAGLYNYYPNLILVIILHLVLNYFAFCSNFFTIKTEPN